MSRNTAHQAQPSIEALIHSIRGQRVILDADLARIYGVTTKRLNEQVKRNIDRFPLDFMFQITEGELNDHLSVNRSQFATGSDMNKSMRSQKVTASLRSQFATSNADTSMRSQFVTSKEGKNASGRGGRRYLPFVFNEHGAIMAANVLNSPSAVQMSPNAPLVFTRTRFRRPLRGTPGVPLTEFRSGSGTPGVPAGGLIY